MDPSEKHLKHTRPAVLNWGGLAGGLTIALALAVGVSQFAQAYRLARCPWLLSSHHGIWDGVGLLLLLLSPAVLFIGLTLAVVVLIWSVYRRRMGDAVCSAFAVIIWVCSFWLGVPGYGGEAGVFRLVRDTQFNRAVAREMAALYQRRRSYASSKARAALADNGSFRKGFPILAKLNPSDLWFGRHSLSLVFGARQMYSLRTWPGPMKSGGGPTSRLMVLYFRTGEDGALIAVSVLPAVK